MFPFIEKLRGRATISLVRRCFIQPQLGQIKSSIQLYSKDLRAFLLSAIGFSKGGFVVFSQHQSQEQEVAYLFIPTQAVGALIGRKGQHIKQLAHFAGASIKVGLSALSALSATYASNTFDQIAVQFYPHNSMNYPSINCRSR